MCVLYDEGAPPGESWAAKNVIGEHYKELAASGAFYEAESFDEVVAGIERALAQPDELAERRRAVVREVVGEVDGRAADRVVDAIAGVSGTLGCRRWPRAARSPSSCRCTRARQPSPLWWSALRQFSGRAARTRSSSWTTARRTGAGTRSWRSRSATSTSAAFASPGTTASTTPSWRGSAPRSTTTIVTLDDDLQNPPEEIPRLLEALAGGADVVYGSPTEEQTGFWRTAGSRLTKLALRSVLGADVAAKVSAFRAFRTELRDAFDDFRGPYVSVDVLLSWATASFAWVPVRHDPRAGGTSHYGFVRLATHAINVLTGFTTRPLRAASLLGLASTFLGVLILVWVFGRYIVEGGSVPGFPFLASMIAIFSGVQLLTLGIIGEYMARMHVRIMDRPPYAIRAVVGAEPAAPPDEQT